MTEFTPAIRGQDSIHQLLVFQIQGVNFGVDARQVASIRDPQSVNPDEIRILKIPELIPFKDQLVNYRSPKILIINAKAEQNAVYVEAPDDIVFLNPFDIKPIPSLILKLNRSKAIWGVYVKDSRTILIIDIYSLMAEDLELKQSL